MPMTAGRIRLAAVALAILLSGCAGAGATGGHTSPAARSEAPAAGTSSGTTSSGSGGTASQGNGATGNGATGTVGGSSAAPAGRIPRPAPARLPWKPKIAVTARVTPTCVHPGQTMHLFVTTRPVAAIAYQAVYSDNRGGGGAPMGAGYGGNDSGYATITGYYTSSWALASNAPAGWARVDVIVGYQGKWGYTGPKFFVEGPGLAGGC